MKSWKSAIAAAGLLILSATTAFAQGAIHEAADFNGDGFKDLAIGAPGEGYYFYYPDGWHNIVRAGVVHVLYGTAQGLTNARTSVLSRKDQSRYSVTRPTNDDRFGSSLTWGDFNRDGFDDLAVGVTGGAGSVDIYYGSPSGLILNTDRTILPTEMPDRGNNSGAFGYALAAGDFNRDGWPDLAISRYSNSSGRGAVYIINGGPAGLSPFSIRILTYFVSFGPTCMTTGDFNGDGFFDLAMGVPTETDSYLTSKGVVLVAPGGPFGLVGTPQRLSQDTGGVAGIAGVGDTFGSALAAADFNRDGKWDLAIGAPGERSAAGCVHVLFGSAAGLTGLGSQFWSQDTSGVQDVAESNDRFGAALAAGHLNGDGFPELAVGAPGEDVFRGAVHVLTIVAGPFGSGHLFFTQDTSGIQDVGESMDRFGGTLTCGNFFGGSTQDLVIGVPGENQSAGAVQFLQGGLSGLTTIGNQMLFQGQGLPDVQELGDGFGVL